LLHLLADVWRREADACQPFEAGGLGAKIGRLSGSG
jgi:hypothetical protein